MNGFIAWWARNPVAANLLMVGILASGLLAYQGIEREFFQNFSPSEVEISVTWQGAAPQEVEEQIIVRIEEALADLDNVESIRSTAREGSARIIVDGTATMDMGEFLAQVKGRVDGVSNLPDDIFPPQVRERVFRQQFLRVAVYGSVGERGLKEIAEAMRDEIALLPGASLAELNAARDEEVSIEVSEAALRRFGLTFDEVAQAVRASSVNLSSGTVQTEVGNISLRARNLADSAEEFEQIILRQTPDGAIIRVGDVATVVDGFVDVPFQATFNGEPAVLIDIRGTERMDVVRTSRAVKQYLEELELPNGVSASLWWDESEWYFDRMGTIVSSAGLGLILVFVTLILFLRPVVAIWVAVGIGTAYVGAFIFLPVNDISLNFLSTFSFLLVLGIVVDDAIIVGEAIHRQTEHGKRGVDASIIGTQLVAKPVLFAVLTTMIAFAPWMFLSGDGAQQTKQISIIVIASLAFSLVEALMILPAHLSHIKPRGDGPLTRFQSKFADSIVKLGNVVYRPLVSAAIKLRYVTIAAFLFLFILSVGILSQGLLTSAFLPDIEIDAIQVDVELPEGAPFSRSLEIAAQLERAGRELNDYYRGRREDAVDVIEDSFTFTFDTSISGFLLLAPPDVRGVPAREMSERLRDIIGDIPDADNVDLISNFGDNDSRIEYLLSSTDLDELRSAVEDLKSELSTYAELYDVQDNLQSSTDEIRLVLKDGAQQLGLTLAEISRQVRQAYFGEEAQRLPRNGEDVRVIVRYSREERRSLDSLQNFRVRTDDGREVPLYAVADIEFAPSLKRIERRERRRAAVVSAEIRAGQDRPTIVNSLDESFFHDFDERHPEVSRGAIGVAEENQRFIQELLSLYIVALFAMYALIAIAFKSYWQPILILSAIPFGFMGAVFGHVIMGLDFTLFSYFGIGAAAGVVVNDNLVLVDFVNRLRDQGVGAARALVEAGVARFRPILLTSVTTFIGVFPLMADQSIQAKFLIPTAAGLAWGVMFALFVTLLFVPALYAVGVDISRFARSLWSGEKLPSFGHGASELDEELPDIDSEDFVNPGRKKKAKDRAAADPDNLAQPDPPPAPAE